MLQNTTQSKFSFLTSNPNIAMLSLILVVLIIAMSMLLPDSFLKAANFQSIAFQLPEIGLLALAMMITMLSGGINLSIIASANLSGIVTAYILTTYIGENAAGGSEVFIIILAIIAGLTVALLIGLLNGFIIAFLNVSPILATLGTMTLVEGISVGTTRGYVISGFPDKMLFFGNETLLGIPVPLFIFIISAVIMSVILNRTALGVSIYMIGSNQTATSFSGINVKKTLLKIYAISGLLCGVASIIMISRFNSASAGYSSSYLLVTVLLAVLGGVDPDGGFGRVSGLVLALVILQMVSSGLNLLRLSSHLTIALWGIILISVIGLRYYSSKRGT